MIYCLAQGGSGVAVVMDPEYDACKQIEAIVSEYLLPQEYEMKYIRKCESALHSDKPVMFLGWHL